MKLDVFDIHVIQNSRETIHFDVLLPEGSEKQSAVKFAMQWLQSVGIKVETIRLESCRFCHSEEANPKIERMLSAQGFAILEMEGCPSPFFKLFGDKLMKLRIVTLITSLTLVTSGLASADENNVPYPKNYRSWTHVKTMLIEPGHQLENPFQGIHHIYANQKAYQGLENGNYSDGAVLVFDLFNYIGKGKTIQEGSRKLTGIMHKDAKKYVRTGGWGFEGFAGDSKTERLVKDGGFSCFGCHMPQKTNGYVFSKLRD